jgi:hypothetical protein
MLLRLSRFTLLACAALSPALVHANHGPGTSGGGVATLSGETLRQDRFDISVSSTYTDFEDVSDAEAIARLVASGADHGHFDYLNHSVITTLDAQYGWNDDLTLGAQIGYYAADDFRVAHIHGDGSTGIHSGDVEGLTDLYLNAKYRFMRGRNGHLAVIGGIKLPTGDDEETISGGSLVHPSSQPGTGSVDYQAGLAYSRFLTSRVTSMPAPCTRFARSTMISPSATASTRGWRWRIV